MGLDQNACLEEIRASIKVFDDQYSVPDNEVHALETASNIIEHFKHFDQFLSVGGPLPAAWQTRGLVDNFRQLSTEDQSLVISLIVRLLKS